MKNTMEIAGALSFAGVAAYCLHDTAMMAATAQAIPDLKRLAGGSAAGRRPPLCRESVHVIRLHTPGKVE